MVVDGDRPRPTDEPQAVRGLVKLFVYGPRFWGLEVGVDALGVGE